MTKILIAVVVLGLFVGGNAYVYQRSNEIESHIAEVQKENETLRKNILSLQEECGFLQAQKLDLAKQIATLAQDRRVGVHKAQLREIITSVLSYLGEKSLADWTRLLMMTAAVESDCGFYLRQVKGPARSIFQIERPTERDALDWARERHPELYAKIKSLRFPAKLHINELQANLAYSTACAYLVYKRKRVSPEEKSMDELVALYKARYNTALGKATIKGTKAKLRAFNIR